MTEKPTLPPILFQDDQLLVINKPAGLIIQDSHTHTQQTLEQALPDDPTLERQGIVHRLDKDTSGVMVVARTPEAQSNLQQQFKNRQVSKEYTALVWGKSPDDHAIIDAPIARHPVYGYKYVVTEGGREAKTELWRQQEYRYQNQPVTLLRIKPHTGRTHQIRVHLAALKLPIVGDKIYGRRKDSAPIRQFLHAGYLQIIHPATGKTLEFRADLPADLTEFLATLSQE
jgi:23S rRNA pseudouridine1911/1915/1917 synthase